MTSQPRNGFTLVELLVALSIFAMLAGAGVLLLGNSVSAQSGIKLHLDDMAAIERMDGALSADLGQAVSRISRTDTGALAPAFFANPQGEGSPVMQFVRTGRDNFNDAPRSALQKVEYWVRQGRLERRTYDQVDGGQVDGGQVDGGQVDGGLAADPAALIEGVQSVSLRFRDEKGDWLNIWTPQQPDLLPKAVEMVLTRTGNPPLTLIFAVGPGPRSEAASPDAAGV